MLSAHAKLRAEVVPSPPEPEPDAIDQAMADHGLAPHRARPPPLPWLPPEAQLPLPL